MNKPTRPQKPRFHARNIGHTMFVALPMLVLTGPRAALAHPPGITQRVSVASDGTEGNDRSGFLSPPAISADGRFVAFDSTATNLIAGGNLPFGIFVHDRRSGTTELVSVSSHGDQAQGLCSTPALSVDGRFVAFDSDAANLVNGDRNGIDDIFLHDRATGQTIRVSVDSGGQEGPGSSHAPAISADGRFVVFHANSDLDPQDTNGTTDVYLRDTLTATTELVSVALDGTAGNNGGFLQDISGDGRFVAFVSSSTNLVANDANGSTADVYVRDRSNGMTVLVSIGNDGTQAEIGFFDIPRISADGRFVVFSTFTALDPADTRPFSLDIYLRDRVANTTELISVNSDEVPGDGRSENASISDDGRFVAFQSDSTNITPEQPTFFLDEDIFVRDRLAGTTVRVSESSAGGEGDARSLVPDISGDGLVVAFSSDATNLVPNDTNFSTDIFVHDDRPAADLAVTTSDAPDPVRKGATLTYTLVATNNGPAPAFSVGLTDQLPLTARFVSATSSVGTCTESGGIVTCELGNLANGVSATVTIVVIPKRLGTIINTAQVSSVSPDANQANNTDTEDTTVTR